MPLSPPPEDDSALAQVLSRRKDLDQKVSVSTLPDVIREANAKHGLQALVTLTFNFAREKDGSVVLDLSNGEEDGEDLWKSPEVEVEFYKTLSDVLMSSCKPMYTGTIRFTFGARHLNKNSRTRHQAEARLFRNDTWYREFSVLVVDPYPYIEFSYSVRASPLIDPDD